LKIIFLKLSDGCDQKAFQTDVIFCEITKICFFSLYLYVKGSWISN